MKTYEDYLKERGYKPGLWNDSFSKTYVSRELALLNKPKKVFSIFKKKTEKSK